MGMFTHGFGFCSSMSRNILLTFSHTINSYTIANPSINNILLAFNLAIQKTSNFINVTAKGYYKVRQPRDTNAHSLNNVTITLVSQEEECTIR